MIKVCPKCKSNRYLEDIRPGVVVCVNCGEMFYNRDLIEIKEQPKEAKK